MSTIHTVRSSHSDRIRVGFIGVGSMAETIHLPSVARHPDCQVVALIDPYADESRLQSLSSIFGCPWYRSAEKITMDIAFLATPISKHVETALPIVRRGIHAFVEKPLAHRVTAAQQLLETADTNNSRVFCGQVRRYNANIKLTRALLNSDLFGQVGSVSLYFGGLYGWHRRYFADAGDTARSIDESVLFDIGAHGLDSILMATGDTLGEISFDRAIVDDTNVCNDIELTGTAQCRKTNRSVRIYAALSNTTNLANVIWIKTQNGTLAISLSDPNSLIFFPHDGASGINLSSTEYTASSPFSAQLEAVLNGVIRGEDSDVDGKLAVPTVSLLENAYDIAEQGACTWLTP